MLFCWESHFFQTMSWVLSLAALTSYGVLFSIKNNTQTSQLFTNRCSGIIINGNIKCPKNRCIGKSNISIILSGAIFACKIVLWRNFDVRNLNAEIGLEKRNDYAKIRKVGISATAKPVLRVHSKTTILMKKGSLMKVESIAECSP